MNKKGEVEHCSASPFFIVYWGQTPKPNQSVAFLISTAITIVTIVTISMEDITMNIWNQLLTK